MDQNSMDTFLSLRHNKIPIFSLISIVTIIIVINFAERENHQIGRKLVAYSCRSVFCRHIGKPMIKTKEKTLRKLFVFYSFVAYRRKIDSIFDNLLKGTYADFRKVKLS